MEEMFARLSLAEEEEGGICWDRGGSSTETNICIGCKVPHG